MIPGKNRADPGDASAVPARRLWRAKYALEWAIALVLAATLLPVGLLLAALVKATSPGPVFYTAERLGRNNRTFRLIKFRSMKVGSPEVRAPSGKVITTASDERLTPIGRFLRLGFDELPQLLNVLRGDMCLIGPRPDVVWQIALYWPRERLRTAVLPGISGLTQVMGGRELDNHQNYELDVRYVVRSGFWMDLWIALLTAPYALGAKKVGQRFFRRHMGGLEAFSDARVAAAPAVAKPVVAPAPAPATPAPRPPAEPPTRRGPDPALAGKTILVLAASRLQVPAITAARRMGLRVVVADGNPRAVGLRKADRWYVIDILDAQACLDVARREKVDGVVHICSEVSMYPMGRINEELGLKGIDSATAVRATNKERMRRAFEAAGAPSPRSIAASTEQEAVAAARMIAGPLIVKPSRNSGKRGISTLRAAPTPQEVVEAFRSALDHSRDPSVVIEELVEGPEFSVEMLIWDGEPRVIAVTDRTNTGPPHWVETGHSIPSQLSEEEQEALRQAAVRGAKALGIDWAAAHAELKLTPRGPVLMEIGARLGGGHITTDLVPLATGIDMVQGAIRLAMGLEPNLTPRRPPRGSAVRFLWPKPGRVLAVDGVRAALALPGVRRVEVDVEIGDTIREIINCARRVGQVIAVGETARDAIARAEAARDTVRIVTTKPATGPAGKTLLVLAAGPLQLPAITTAKRMGLRVVAADADPRAPGLALADKGYTIDILDAAACLIVAQRERVSGVIHICSEVSMYAMGRINEVLKLRGVNTAVAVRATNKARMRRAFEAAGAPSPRSIMAATEEDALAAADEIGWPLIVKPSRNSGSRGVTSLRANVGQEALLAAFCRAVAESRDGSAVIERYVEGPEFSIEILIWNGQPHVLALTDKVTTEAPYFVETGHSQPSRQPPDVQAAILDAAVRGVRALGIDWAAAHAEVKLAPDGPYLMEIGARLGGDFITTELVPRSTGIDMVEGTIRLALGEAPDLTPRHPPRGACIRYLTPRPGRVREIRGVDRARRMPGVEIVEVDVAPGGDVPGLTSSLTRVGHVIAEGCTAEEAIAHAEAARDAVEIVTE